MLIKLCNLPSNFRYQDVKALIHSSCGISEIILDNLTTEKGKKKVTVGLAEEEDAAMVKRKLHGYNLNGFILNVEVVGGKKPAPKQSNNPSSYQPPRQGYQVQAEQTSIPSSQYQLPRMLEMPTAYQNNVMPTQLPALIAYPNIYGGMNQSAYANTGFQPQIAFPSTSYDNAGLQNTSRKQDNSHEQSPWVSENMNFWNTQQNNSRTIQDNLKNYNRSNTNEYQTQEQSFSGNYNRDYTDNNAGNRGRGYNDSGNNNRDRNFCDRDRDTARGNQDQVWQQPPKEDSNYQGKSHRQESYTFSNSKMNSQDFYNKPGNSGKQRFGSRWDQDQRDGDQQSSSRGGKRFNEMDNDYDEPRRKTFKKDSKFENSGPSRASPWAESQHPFHNKNQPSQNTYEPYQHKNQSSQNKYQNKPFQNKPNPNKNQPFQNPNPYKYYKNQAPKPGPSKAPFKKPEFQAPQKPPKYNTRSKKNEIHNFKLSKKQLGKGLRLDNMTPDQLKELQKNRGITWRYQVGATIATDMLSRLGKLNNDADFKQALKYAVVERLNTICGEDYTIPMFDMAQIYRNKYKVNTDAAFVKKVQDDIAKITAEIEAKEPGATQIVRHPGAPSRVLQAIAEKLPKYPMADKRVAKLLKKENKLIFEDENLLVTRLQPGLQRALQDELSVMTEKILDGIINDDRPPAQKVHDERIGAIANELTKALKINIGKRLLGAGPIIIRIFANPKLVKVDRLAILLKPYGVVSIRKTEKRNNVMFIATCQTYEQHDTLVTMPPLVENGTTIICKPFQLVGEKVKLKPNDIKKQRLIEYRNRIDDVFKAAAKSSNAGKSQAGNVKQAANKSGTGKAKPNVAKAAVTAKVAKSTSEGVTTEKIEAKTNENNSDQIQDNSEVKTDLVGDGGTDLVGDGGDKTEGNNMDCAARNEGVKDFETAIGNDDTEGDEEAGAVNDGNDNAGAVDGGNGNAGAVDDGNDNAGAVDDGNGNAGAVDDGNDNAGAVDDGNGNAGAVDDGNDNAGAVDDGNGNAGAVDDGNDNAGNDGNDNEGYDAERVDDWVDGVHDWNEGNDNGEEEGVENGEGEGVNDRGEEGVDNEDEGGRGIEGVADGNDKCHENNDIDLDNINEDDLEDY